MNSNPLLQRLGFAPDDRVVIVHADDIGMCQAGIAALDGLQEAGIVSSMAVMAPCPWFPAAAAYCRAHPDLDMGLHCTFTSEWESYRWSPLSTRDPSSGLLDSDGFFHRRSEDMQANADMDCVLIELEAQFSRAREAGIDLTHMDGHMYTVLHPKYLVPYLQTAARHALPAFCLRMDEEAAAREGYDEPAAKEAARFTAQLEEQGIPLVDSVYVMPLDTAEERLETAKQAFRNLPAGLSYFLLHPSCDTPELRAIAPDWRCRVADYETFTGEPLRAFLRESGIHVIGWRPIRELVRSTGPGG